MLAQSSKGSALILWLLGQLLCNCILGLLVVGYNFLITLQILSLLLFNLFIFYFILFKQSLVCAEYYSSLLLNTIYLSQSMKSSLQSFVFTKSLFSKVSFVPPDPISLM